VEGGGRGGGVTKQEMCVLIFFTISVRNIYHSKNNSARYSHNVEMPSCKVAVFCQILNKLKFSQQTFENSSNIKFHKNISCGSRVIP
jgi:hypothetical protein